MKYTLALLLLLFCFAVHGQEQNKYATHDHIPGNIPDYKPAYQENYPDWAKMLYQEEINFNTIEKAFQKWEQQENTSFRAIRRYYKIWRQHILPYVKPDGSILIADQKTYLQNLHQQQTAFQTDHRDNTTPWSFLGPKETFWLNESGSSDIPSACPWQLNIYSFDIANTNDSILYCGSETGFVSKSVDNGDTWNLLGLEYNFGGGVTALAIHPTDENTVYLSAGAQVHKTIDGGQSWAPLLPLNQLFGANKLLIDEENPNIILAAGNSGVFLSTDAGQSWSNTWPQQTYDIHTQAGNSEVVYAISSDNNLFQIAISTDGGNTFSVAPNAPEQIEDVSGGLLAVSPADPAQLLAIMLSSDNTPIMYKGDMVQNTWELLATGQTTAFPLNNGQGFYDLVLEVSPVDPDIIYAGTTTLYKSTNGGNTFSAIGGYQGSFPIHPDVQSMKLLDNGTAWVATDGGFTFSSDNFISTNNAIAKNNNLIGSDMWGFDQGWNEDLIVGGRYHNGNTAIADFYQPKALRMGGAESPTGWVMQGKSKHVAFNDLGAGWILPETATSSPQGRFIFSKYPNMDEYGGRRGNMVFHPNYYELIYLGEGNAIWKSSDMGITFEMLHDFGDRIRFLQISQHDPNVLYADIIDQGLHRSDDGGYTWSAKPSLTNGSNGSSYWRGKLHFVLSPNDENTIYACLQNGTWSADIGKVFKSTDGGSTWTDWTGTLNVFTKTLAIQPDENGDDLLYLFTSNKNGQPGQCYIRKEGENDWTIHGEAYPAGMAPNHALPFFRDSKIRVAGSGGIWENSLSDTNFQPIIQPWVGRPFYNCMLDTIQFDDHSILNHTGVSWSWSIQPTPLYISDPNSRNPKVVLGSADSYDVTLTVTKDGNTYSKTIENMVTATTCPSLEDCNNPAFLAKDEWELIYVNSEEVNYPGLATMAFDNNPETIWHTRWSSGNDPYPHEIQIDMGAVYEIYEFTYLPRQQGQNGWIKDYELYFTEDLSDWGEPDTVSVFESSAAPHKVSFPNPKIGRYVKLVALSEVNGNPWASAAEFDIKGCYYNPVSSQETLDYQKLKAFPMPTSGLLTISLPYQGKFNYSVYTLSGKIIHSGQQQVDNSTITLDLSHRPNGSYVIRLTDSNRTSYLVKVIKKG